MPSDSSDKLWSYLVVFVKYWLVDWSVGVRKVLPYVVSQLGRTYRLPRGPTLWTCWLIRDQTCFRRHLFELRCRVGGFQGSIPPQNQVGSSISTRKLENNPAATHKPATSTKEHLHFHPESHNLNPGASNSQSNSTQPPSKSQSLSWWQPMWTLLAWLLHCNWSPEARAVRPASAQWGKKVKISLIFLSRWKCLLVLY